MLSRQPLTKLELDSRQRLEPSGHVSQGPRQGERLWTISGLPGYTFTWDTAQVSPRNKKNTSKTQVEYLGTKVLEATAPAHLSKATKIFNEGDEGGIHIAVHGPQQRPILQYQLLHLQVLVPQTGAQPRQTDKARIITLLVQQRLGQKRIRLERPPGELLTHSVNQVPSPPPVALDSAGAPLQPRL